VEPEPQLQVAFPDAEPAAQRRCGRCQQSFDADPDLFFQTDWALCPACTEILMPRRMGAPATSPLS
jgi:hypothetical protein